MANKTGFNQLYIFISAERCPILRCDKNFFNLICLSYYVEHSSNPDPVTLAVLPEWSNRGMQIFHCFQIYFQPAFLKEILSFAKGGGGYATF